MCSRAIAGNVHRGLWSKFILYSFVHKDQLWLVMQLMNKGSCLHVMNLLKRKGMGEGLKVRFYSRTKF